MSPDLDVAVVGAGLAGLATAHRLRAQGRSVHVFESADQVGGRMRTLRQDGYTVDTGAEMLSSSGYQATWRLLADLGIEEEHVPLIGRGIAVWREGKPRKHVGDLRGLFSGAGLSTAARLNLVGMLSNATLRRRSYSVDRPERTPLGTQTIAEVARGDLHDYLLQPLSGGFFGWDTSVACAGPLVSHMLAVGPTKTLRSYDGGMDFLTRLLAEQVEVSTGVAVREVVTTSTGARLVADKTPLTARTVVLAVPAPVAAELHPEAPEYVHLCRYQPMIKLICLLDRPLTGAGRAFALAVPAVENPLLAGVVFDDRKNPDRVPEGAGMVTLVASPGSVAGLLDQGDDEISRVLIAEAERYVPGVAHALRSTVVVRHQYGLPMPTAEAIAIRGRFAVRPVVPVEYAGDWYTLRPSSESAARSAEIVVDRLATAVQPVTAGG
ncbi:protoporphyrinogen/coproporphyrinogen oxidase [Actinokineospora inagensis]|uniref:protoporphyrinogen/coproporphyrinogen oxidase n=1 Tax=Actinokineospora inagensis TaxID=103730 RepID=UPI000406ED9F|nr:NAD(P)/FAD-dependent oxidoreductase [Actinokineospora inagensis]